MDSAKGRGKWPVDYADSLPPVVNVGLGSPTGVKFGNGEPFPGGIPARVVRPGLDVRPHHRGASRSPRSVLCGRFETFLQGRPLNLTALDFGPDGAMYFITGGRKTRSALYRVRYNRGDAKKAASTPIDPAVEERRALEALQGKEDAAAVDCVWPALGSDDRFLRHAARIALESQPVAQWSARALSENDPRRALTALLALARLGSQEDRAAVIARISQWWPQLNTESLQIDALRVAELALARSGQPYPESKGALETALDDAYPAKSFALNRELSHSSLP